MPITKPTLSEEEKRLLLEHLLKHKIYPYRYRINKTLENANFASTDASGLVRYTTFTFRPKATVGIVSIATNFIVTPNTVVDTFGVAISYSSVFTLADNVDPLQPDEEAKQIYEVKSQGGAINDFQVFYPLNWYVEAGTPIYMHFFVGTGAISASNKMIGHVILGALEAGAQ